MILREGLPPGIALAMVAHAAGESSRMATSLDPDAHAAVLEAGGPELLALEAQLRGAGVAHAAIREPDEPYCGELLAIGVAPQQRGPLRRFLSRFRLAGKTNK